MCLKMIDKKRNTVTIDEIEVGICVLRDSRDEIEWKFFEIEWKSAKMDGKTYTSNNFRSIAIIIPT